VADARCTKRGRRLQFVAVDVHDADGGLVAQAMVTVSISPPG
jgi:acyl-coenzyme A thioesterase PaaI-like protein